MIVGSIIIANSSEAVSILKPVPPKVLRTNGTSVRMPKNPYTTDGMPAISAIIGCRIFIIGLEENLAM